jgi:hypothetical protein
MQSNADSRRRPDAVTLACLALIAFGWFGMNTLVVSFGRLAQATHFYEIGVALAHPVTLFIGVGEGHALLLGVSTLLAATGLLAVMAIPLLRAEPDAWLSGWIPLALMLTCLALLYFSGSGTPPARLDAGDPGLRADLLRLANHVMQRAQRALVAHISLGAGAVLSLSAGIVLGMHCTRRFLAGRVLLDGAAQARAATSAGRLAFQRR